MTLADLRQKYEKDVLLESSLAATPLKQFSKWFDEAMHAGVPEPNTMTLATADANGRPSARIVLLKGLSDEGITFFTNYDSRKGRDLAVNPQASLLFFWEPMERQVRIEGRVEKISAEKSDEYYKSRPLGSRIGAWASPQSQPITHEELEKRNEELTRSLGTEPARPPYWGGYLLKPDYVEFWQGRPSRLHDRLAYTRNGSAWIQSRLAP
ncbi:MAG: pyridoxamine 5'-phosphate oxidase [Burkholderiaceae bacterium]|nr:MAG: pyridoxamine 5'-phosphate oxidase [Burkholderiaceae bacterium]